MTTCSVSIAAHYLREITQMPTDKHNQELTFKHLNNIAKWCDKLSIQCTAAMQRSKAKDIAQDKQVRLILQELAQRQCMRGRRATI